MCPSLTGLVRSCWRSHNFGDGFGPLKNMSLVALRPSRETSPLPEDKNLVSKESHKLSSQMELNMNKLLTFLSLTVLNGKNRNNDSCLAE